jgi:hypothetical protein
VVDLVSKLKKKLKQPKIKLVIKTENALITVDLHIYFLQFGFVNGFSACQNNILSLGIESV